MILIILPILSLLMFLFPWSYRALIRFGLSSLTASGLYLTITTLSVLKIFNMPIYLGDHLEWRIDQDVYVWNQFWTISDLIVAWSAYLVMFSSFIFSVKYFYLEKEARKFFALLPLILFGILLITSGNSLDVVIIGWESVEIASIFLISFYAYRTRAIRNTLRIFVIYKLCDIGLLVTSLFLQHKKGIHAIASLQPWLQEYVWQNGVSIHVIAFMTILAASGKSALFPFFNWPARAMEGPTPSSALFYGGPVLHLGVFLLIKLKDLILFSDIARGTLVTLGLLTFITARLVARTQSTIKGQLAYKAVSHIGLIGIWIAFNWIILATIHICIHMIYRAIRLILTPSAAYERAHEGLKSYKTSNLLHTSFRVLPESLKSQVENSLFALGLQEFFLSPTERGGLGWLDLSRLKHKFVTEKPVWLFTVGFLILAFSILFQTPYQIPDVALLILTLATLLSLKNVLSYKSVLLTHVQQLINTLFFIFGIWLSTQHFSTGFLWFCIMLSLAFTLSWIALSPYLSKPLNTFHGLKYVNMNRYRIMVVSFLIAAGYPVTPMFIAEDSLYSELLHVSLGHTFMAFLFLFLLAIYWMRLMVRIFWGFHFKALIHPVFPPLKPHSS